MPSERFHLIAVTYHQLVAKWVIFIQRADACQSWLKDCVGEPLPNKALPSEALQSIYLLMLCLSFCVSKSFIVVFFLKPAYGQRLFVAFMAGLIREAGRGPRMKDIPRFQNIHYPPIAFLTCWL